MVPAAIIALFAIVIVVVAGLDFHSRLSRLERKVRNELP
jgi:uncharacterized membrane protein SpoIIM required for sporulation